MSKKRLQVTVREDLVKWMDKKIMDLRFASRSHVIEYALLKLSKSEITKFNVMAEITIDKKFEVFTIKKSIINLLRKKFSLENMLLGQPVRQTNIVSIIQNIEGIVSVKLKYLYASEKSEDLSDLESDPDRIYVINPDFIILSAEVV